MGKANSKCNNQLSIISHTQSLLSSCHSKRKHIDLSVFISKERLRTKKKVLMLGLDGVGKTDLFSRLICHEKQTTTATTKSLPQPTMGYNVETIKVHCNHFCHRRSHEITLWDCGGQSSLQPLWSYHFSNTSLLLWLINVHDRSRLDTNLQLLSQILTNPLLYRVPVLIISYHSSMKRQDEKKTFDDDKNENLLTNLEIAFRFLSTLAASHASTFKWQVISINLNDNSTDDLRKLRQSFKELMEL
ncbi:unnamed protein product [Adineta steineri]|uniref:Uncharacterized protein n=1 Tax=Adineta steineri TaxID=433720 RepID=A0A819M9J7_9BILA|nr:unnamed protein product [Adineta steineri]